MDAEQIKQVLGLQPHPAEGGFFAETYRPEEGLAKEHLPEPYAGGRSVGTAIYYLLTPDSFSAMHRLKSDEVFHFCLGDPVEMFLLDPQGASGVRVLGTDLAGRAAPAGGDPSRRLAGAPAGARRALPAARHHGRTGLRLRGLRVGRP